MEFDQRVGTCGLSGLCPLLETFRKGQQERNQLVDVTHLVEKKVCAFMHASFSHSRQVVVRQDNDRYSFVVRRITACGPSFSNHTNPISGTQLYIYYERIERKDIQLFNCLGFRSSTSGNHHFIVLRKHADETRAKERRVFNQ